LNYKTESQTPPAHTHAPTQAPEHAHDNGVCVNSFCSSATATPNPNPHLNPGGDPDAEPQFSELVRAYGAQGGSVDKAREEFDRCRAEPGFDLRVVIAHVSNRRIREVVLRADSGNPLWLSRYLEERRWVIDPLPTAIAALLARWPRDWDATPERAAAHGEQLGIARPQDDRGPLGDPYYRQHLRQLERADQDAAMRSVGQRERKVVV
jgi:hypothetical protein